jgi:hypothetical protein
MEFCRSIGPRAVARRFYRWRGAGDLRSMDWPVCKICQRFAAKGETGLVSGKRRRKPDEQRLLTAAAMVWHIVS